MSRVVSCLLAASLLGWVAAQRALDTDVAPDRYCLSCLCVASSDCNPDARCRSVGERSFCGPFYITRHFWLDSNVTALSKFSSYDYRTCASDTECAGEAVSRYLSKYSTDCDGDGRITCKDFGLAHLLGHAQCHDLTRRRDAEQTIFVERFAQCLLTTIELLRGGESVPPTCIPQSLRN